MARLSRYFELVRDARGQERLRVHLDGAALARLALTNKGTAFPEAERVALGLDGLLPPQEQTLELQIERTYASFLRQPTALAQYSYLRALQERNEILFYALVERHLEQMLPIIYTPTVGDAVKQASAIYQGARGLSLSPNNVHRTEEVAQNCILDDVRMLVATDSSAILGIGDQGWGGLSIAIGKLAIYTVAGGVSPYRSLPIGLDVGTDREDLLAGPAYLGVRQKRLRGDAYLAFMDRFVEGVKKRWPRAVLQWEDLSKDTAFEVLERYRKVLPSFNDDIQGTGAVALAGLVSAARLRGRRLADDVFVVHGAGAGGAGVAAAIVEGLVREGLSRPDAHARVLVLDSRGLLVEGRAMEAYKVPFAQPRARVETWGDTLDLQTVIERGRATVLLGLSGQPGVFTEPMVRALAAHTERPVVFPLSNPTSSSEATPADVLAWSGGRAIVATGSPFAPVPVGDRLVPIGQGNNAFVFPGLGMGAILSDASEISDGMVMAAAYALAEYVEEKHLAAGLVYPPVSELRAVSERVAVRVVEQAFDEGLARTKKTTREGAAAYVAAKAWAPRYLPYERAPGTLGRLRTPPRDAQARRVRGRARGPRSFGAAEPRRARGVASVGACAIAGALAAAGEPDAAEKGARAARQTASAAARSIAEASAGDVPGARARRGARKTSSVGARLLARGLGTPWHRCRGGPRRPLHGRRGRPPEDAVSSALASRAPWAASASARSFPALPAWPRTHRNVRRSPRSRTSATSRWTSVATAGSSAPTSPASHRGRCFVRSATRGWLSECTTASAPSGSASSAAATARSSIVFASVPVALP